MLVSRKRWLEVLRKNKSQYPLSKRWRVEEKKHDQYYIIGYNTFAIDKDGTISGICKNPKSALTGIDILMEAISKGGNKLQAFGEKLYEFYTENGFTPICTVKFNKKYAPKGCTKKDTLVLYYYTKRKTNLSLKQVKKILPEFNSFVKAQEYRNFIMGE